ncbi:MAG: rhodanese-like domain-containing protein [Oligoflexia bacterium]|nr:rhodanese-like domain-containing protein [Oligoflexia bacterium]
MDTNSVLLAVGLLVAYQVYRYVRARGVRAKLPELRARGAVIVDVRSPAEFRMGGNPESINIPLAELGRRLESLDRAKPVVVCCASGGRSAVAAGLLKKAGFPDVQNAGPWVNTLER